MQNEGKYKKVSDDKRIMAQKVYLEDELKGYRNIPLMVFVIFTLIIGLTIWMTSALFRVSGHSELVQALVKGTVRLFLH